MNITTNNESLSNVNEYDEYTKIAKVASKAKNLQIEIINSTSEPKGLTLKISPFGLTNSPRNEKDGITYFGFEDLDATSV